jgi:regulatory protein spx
LQAHNADVDIRDYFKEPFTITELTKLIGTRPIADFISTRAKSFKEHGWDKKPPTKKQAIAAIVKEPTLLKRPLLVDGKEILIGFSQSAYDAKVK